MLLLPGCIYCTGSVGVTAQPGPQRAGLLAECQPSTASVEQDAKAVYMERVVAYAGRWPQCCAKLCKVQAVMQGSARWDLAV